VVTPDQLFLKKALRKLILPKEGLTMLKNRKYMSSLIPEE